MYLGPGWIPSEAQRKTSLAELPVYEGYQKDNGHQGEVDDEGDDQTFGTVTVLINAALDCLDWHSYSFTILLTFKTISSTPLPL